MRIINYLFWFRWLNQSEPLYALQFQLNERFIWLIHSTYKCIHISNGRVKSEDTKYWQMNFAFDLFLFVFISENFLFQHNVINNQLNQRRFSWVGFWIKFEFWIKNSATTSIKFTRTKQLAHIKNCIYWKIPRAGSRQHRFHIEIDIIEILKYSID